MDETMICGSETHVSLSSTAPLTLPWVQDPFGAMRPPLSLDAMRMSVELAAATYGMNIDPWIKAGWQDVTIQVDGDLTRGIEPSPKPVQWLTSAWKLHRVRSRMQQKNPIGQMVGALRQIEKSDTGKVLVMCHPAENGRYVVAISFMGTGARFYDWFSNFRMVSEDGMHKGFLQLARQFEENEKDITFPQTAHLLGLENLTLRQIIEEARQPNSRFTLWLVGHSQGGALVQVYCRHKLEEDRVQPGNIVGYGFASPSVASGDAVQDPSAYPLYHIINSDDLVPRMGSQVHLGLLLVYPAGEELRRQCYPWPRDEQSVRNRIALRPLMRQMRDTASCIEMGIAYFHVLENRSPEEMMSGMSDAAHRHPALRRVLTAADNRVDKLMRYLCRRLTAAYHSITGEEVDKTRVAAMQQQIAEVMDDIGSKAFSAALQQLMAYPHACVRKTGALMGSYPYITLFGAQELRPMVWRSGRPPRLVGVTELGVQAAPRQLQALYNRRRAEAPRYHRNARSYSEQRSHPQRRHVPLLMQGSARSGEKLVEEKKA